MLIRCSARAMLLAPVAIIVTSFSAWAQELDPDFIIRQYTGSKVLPSEVNNVEPTTPNPWTSLRLPETYVDWQYWSAKRYQTGIDRAADNRPAKLRRTGINGGTLLLQLFGTGPSQVSTVQITGNFVVPTPTAFEPKAEDEGSILLASETFLKAGSAIVVDSMIGDGPFGLAGAGTGDFDFYAIRNVREGAIISVDIDTEIPRGFLDPFVAVYNSNGTIIAQNDDFGGTFDSFVSFPAPADGDYFVSVGTFGNAILRDPFDSSSGNGVFRVGGSANEGTYKATIGLDLFAEVSLAFTPNKGDVVGAAINGTPARLSLFDKSGILRQSSQDDANGFFPTGTPLPAGMASVGHVVDRTGLFTLTVRSSQAGPYTLDIASFLPELRDGDRGEVQTVFIDFDGATFDRGPVFGGSSSIRTLSPLSAFLPNWGLTAADEDAVIDAIMAVIEESLVSDLEAGPNPKFKVRLLNSRDHEDPFGQPNVSRVIVGGTIPELGINTIGLAQSIDVGNYDTEETAVTLLDILSGQRASTANLNNIPRAPGVSIIDLIGVAVGEITAHEAGHYLGSWHTDQFNDIPNIMDQGGNLNFTILGLGPDGIFGTADDTNVKFVRDEFVPNEGFGGIEDVESAISFGSTQAR